MATFTQQMREMEDGVQNMDLSDPQAAAVFNTGEDCLQNMNLSSVSEVHPDAGIYSFINSSNGDDVRDNLQPDIVKKRRGKTQEPKIITKRRSVLKTPEDIQESFKNVYSIMGSSGFEKNPAYKILCKELQILEKAQVLKKTKHAPNRVTGFTKPFQLLPPVAHFLNSPSHEPMSRSQVTHHVNEYVKTKKLSPPKASAVSEDSSQLQKFSLDENLALYFGGGVDAVESYSSFTRRIKFAFPIVPKVKVVESLSSISGADCDAVVVVSYNAEFLVRPSDGDLFQKQIFLNRQLAEFSEAAKKFAIDKSVLFFAVNNAVDVESFVFVQTRGSQPDSLSLDQFSVRWLGQRLGSCVATY